MEEVLKYNLGLDYSDRTAADVLAANPDLFSSEDEIPEFLFKSLKTLIFGDSASSTSNDDYQKKIVAGLGTGDGVSNAITIVSGDVYSASHYPGRSNCPRPDLPGAETAECQIIVNFPKSVDGKKDNLSYKLMSNLCNRIIFVLDNESRNFRNAPALAIVNVPLISKKLWFRVYITGYSGNIRAGIARMQVTVEYVKAYAR